MTTARVLYVDDDRLCLQGLKRLLRSEPYRLITFDAPEAALRKITQIRPAVVISDQRMPGMMGTQFLKAVRELQPDSVRMVMTGFTDMETALAAINEGHVFRFIPKPFETEALKAEIEAALQYHQWIAEANAVVDPVARWELIHRERLTGVRELAVAVRHELGQPMAVIQGYAQLLQEQMDKTHVGYVFINNILEQLDRMQHFTRRLTTIVRYKTSDYPGQERIIDIDRSTM